MQITDTERRLIALISETRFGRIEGFWLRGGFPVLNDNTDVYAEYKLSGPEPRAEPCSEIDYASRPQIRAMLGRFRALGDGFVSCLDVRDGLPFKMTVKRSALT